MKKLFTTLIVLAVLGLTNVIAQSPAQLRISNHSTHHVTVVATFGTEYVDLASHTTVTTTISPGLIGNVNFTGPNLVAFRTICWTPFPSPHILQVDAGNTQIVVNNWSDPQHINNSVPLLVANCTGPTWNGIANWNTVRDVNGDGLNANIAIHP